ncbi:ribonuclease H-like domain-containing protein [Tanacetum coccineum]
MVTIRCILSIDVSNNRSLFQLDINNAFLYGDLNEDVYMTLPESYSDIGDKRVCKLVNSLYRLKQAPKKLNEKLTSVLLADGFVQSLNDFLFFIKNDKDFVLILLVYVDDIIVTGCKPYSTPIEVNPDNKKVVSKYGDDETLTGITHYHKLVGKLIYLTMTRPNIFYVVHSLSQVMHNLMKSHLRLAFRVLRYLAFGRHLEEIHVTWAHLEKKRTRLRTYTNISQDYVLSGWRRRHQFYTTPSQPTS